MSDYEDDYYDLDDDFFLFEEDPGPEFDVVIPSPVLVGYEPSMDIQDIYSDWEYYSDDYYDDNGPKTPWGAGHAKNNASQDISKTAKAGVKATGTQRKKRKFRRLSNTSNIPELSLDGSVSSDNNEPVSPGGIVRWRAKGDRVSKPVDPALDKSPKISLMPDWRDKVGLLPDDFRDKESGSPAEAEEEARPAQKNSKKRSHEASRDEGNFEDTRKRTRS